jgi:hypothetical protein
MEEVKDIILNVYTLNVQQSPSSSSSIESSRQQSSSMQASNSSNSNSWSSFLVNKMLPTIGMGAYHTSIRIGADGPYATTYTFACNKGIVQQKQPRQRRTTTTINTETEEGLPSNAIFKEEIVLGSCTCHRQQINEIIHILTTYYFTTTSYHLVHRNCNHFTKTFATALIYYQDYIQFYNINNNMTSLSAVQQPKRFSHNFIVSTYPDYINRLANTGSTIISHDTDIVPCHPYNEAYHAVTKRTMDEHPDDTSNNHKKSSWNIKSIISKSDSTTNTNNSKGTKKELTEKQKQLLEKIRKK